MASFTFLYNLPSFVKQVVPKSHIKWLLLGFLARFLLVFTDANYDLQSYVITADLVLEGQPPWQSQRYNYGVVWSLVLVSLRLLTFHNYFSFRFAIVVILSIVDFGIYICIKRWFTSKNAIIFFTNPISILITGHYLQFDNFALLFGMVGIYYLQKHLQDKSSNYFVSSIWLFTLSLSTKHILLLFLPWLLFLPISFLKRIKIVVIPITLFLLQFAPFVFISDKYRRSIVSNVFMYWSSNNAPFWKFWFFDKSFAESLGDNHLWHHGRLWMILMFAALFVTGIAVRNLELQNQFAVFTIAVIIFASAITSQFLAISAIGAAVFFNPLFLLYFLIATLYLIADPAGLGYLHLTNFLLVRGWNSWTIAPFLLSIAALFSFWQRGKLINRSKFSCLLLRRKY